MGCTFTVSDFIKKWWKIFFTKACLGFSYEYQGDQIHKVNLGLWFFLAVRSSLCHWEYRDGREHRLGQYTGYIPLPLLPTYSLLPPLLSFCLASYLGSSNNCFGKYRCLPSIAGEKKKKKGISETRSWSSYSEQSNATSFSYLSIQSKVRHLGMSTTQLVSWQKQRIQLDREQNNFPSCTRVELKKGITPS